MKGSVPVCTSMQTQFTRSFKQLVLLAFFFASLCIAGCGASNSKTSATSKDELSTFLENNPEFQDDSDKTP